MANKITHWFIIGTFVLLYFIVSIISTIHVIDFFKLSNPDWLAIALAIAFEIGAAASLASLIILKKTSKVLVWSLFVVLTLVQAMGNTYYAFSNLEDYQGWIELFGLMEQEPIAQKRILSIISGAILPLVALGFIKSLVDYIKPEEDKLKNTELPSKEDNVQESISYVIPSNTSNDAIGEMEKEVDTLLAYKDEKEREVIKDKIRNKMLELVNKEKDHLNHTEPSVASNDTEIVEGHAVENTEDKTENIEERTKPFNKKRTLKKNETIPHYGNVT